MLRRDGERGIDDSDDCLFREPVLENLPRLGEGDTMNGLSVLV